MHTVYPYICLLKKIEHGTKNFRIPFSRIPNIIHLIFTLILTYSLQEDNTENKNSAFKNV